jgi:hypothetical protein
MRNDPYMTTARFASTCPETSKPIKRGDEIAYYPSVRKAYHRHSTTAAQVRELQFAKTWEMADQNW